MLFLRKILLIAIMVMFAINNKLEAALSPVAESLTPKEELHMAITSKDVNIICMQRTFDPFGPIVKIQEYIEYVFNTIDTTIYDDAWTFVIFSENFWGGPSQALTSSEVKGIVNACNELSGKHRKLIVHINFLHKFHVLELLHQCPWLSIGTIMEYDDSKIFGEVKPSLEAFKKESNMHISNYSLLIYAGSPFAIYRKSTYANEGDMDITIHGCIYEFGDFKTHAIMTNDISDIFTCEYPKIVTRICADMNELFLSDIPSTADIVIVPANMKIVDEPIKNINVGNIILVDTHPFRGISHLQKVHNSIPLSIHRPECRMSVDLCGSNGFKLYKYRLSDVVEFPSVNIVPMHFDQHDDNSGGKCCKCVIF